MPDVMSDIEAAAPRVLSAPTWPAYGDLQ